MIGQSDCFPACEQACARAAKELVRSLSRFRRSCARPQKRACKQTIALVLGLQHSIENRSNVYTIYFVSCFRGQNPLHILAQYAKDNAVAIFDLFRQSMPDYPINALDADENIGECNSEQWIMRCEHLRMH